MFETSDKVVPVFVPALSRKVLYAFQVPQTNGFLIYDLDSLKEDDEFNVKNSIGWCTVDGTTKIEDFPYPIQFAYSATKEMFELIDKTKMYLSDDWEINWRLGKVENLHESSTRYLDYYITVYSVIYKFISEDTIKCIDLNTFRTFFTSYRSLKV